MLKKNVNDAINKQINEELYSAYLYLSMASYLEEMNLPGFANWMRIQFEEEQFHAFKMYDYVIERGGRVILDTIEKPESEFGTIIDIFEASLNHEQHISECINELMSLAIEEKDYASSNFLQWYVDEQVEEEAAVGEILGKLKLVEGKGQALLMLDKEFSERVFTPPTAEE